MPWNSVDEMLPKIDGLDKYPKEAQKEYLRVVNGLLAKYAEKKAIALAWYVIKRKFTLVDGKWQTAKSEMNFEKLATPTEPHSGKFDSRVYILSPVNEIQTVGAINGTPSSEPLVFDFEALKVVAEDHKKIPINYRHRNLNLGQTFDMFFKDGVPKYKGRFYKEFAPLADYFDEQLAGKVRNPLGLSIECDFFPNGEKDIFFPSGIAVTPIPNVGVDEGVGIFERVTAEAGNLLEIVKEENLRIAVQDNMPREVSPMVEEIAPVAQVEAKPLEAPKVDAEIKMPETKTISESKPEVKPESEELIKANAEKAKLEAELKEMKAKAEEVKAEADKMKAEAEKAKVEAEATEFVKKMYGKVKAESHDAWKGFFSKATAEQRMEMTSLISTMNPLVTLDSSKADMKVAKAEAVLLPPEIQRSIDNLKGK